jgi:hypothetical protein
MSLATTRNLMLAAAFGLVGVLATLTPASARGAHHHSHHGHHGGDHHHHHHHGHHKHHHHHHHHKHDRRRLALSGPDVEIPFADSDSEDCEYYYGKWQRTGSRYWRSEYFACTRD